MLHLKRQFFKKITQTAILAVAIGLNACSSENKNESATTDTTSTTTSSAKAKPPAPAAAAVGQVNVFMEISGSMKGFMPAGNGGQITQFQETLDALLAMVQQNNQMGQKQFFEVREKIYPADYNQVSKHLRYGLEETASSSTIPVMLDSIISNYSSPNGVNVFISDFIYAPANGQAVNFVTTDIYRVIAKAQQQGQAVSIFGTTSNFKGTFYPAVKTTRKTIPNCCDTEVPYYVWVMGNPKQVQLFNRQLMAGKFTDELHLGFEFSAPAYAVLDKFMPVGNWYCSSTGNACQDITVSDLKTPLEMVIGLDLAQLPASYTNEAYLKKNLKLSAENSDVQITGLYTAAQFKTQKGVAGQNTSPLKPYTHFVKAKLTKMVAPEIELQIALQNQRPAWVQSRTTTNDSQINREGAKTFQLAGIVAGVERAYSTGNAGNTIFTATIRAKKE
ncbi:hypothetical protein [Adhaeribacter pallidiroseus]|uniref:Uncharacterized protein n=1 Tax=Adhaeribacter pallidiroseus TaxID=2072847 RepID=A0A369QRV9_9BACT|nr:hypothetical protein [Adhaeribacter pallidiroseus]RDC65977.1 hypothetical protein AHMF7616_04608 [Adhaeribacter pallidiroseus]